MIEFQKKGEFMLDLNFGVMLIEAGIFLITFVLLKIWLFDPLLKFMEEREAKLENMLKMTKSNSSEAKQLEEEIDEILDKARKEAKAIKEDAKAKALKEAEKIKSAFSVEIEAAKVKLAEEIKKEKEKIIKYLKNDKSNIKRAIENKLRDVA